MNQEGMYELISTLDTRVLIFYYEFGGIHHIVLNKLMSVATPLVSRLLELGVALRPEHPRSNTSLTELASLARKEVCYV